MKRRQIVLSLLDNFARVLDVETVCGVGEFTSELADLGEAVVLALHP